MRSGGEDELEEVEGPGQSELGCGVQSCGVACRSRASRSRGLRSCGGQVLLVSSRGAAAGPASGSESSKLRFGREPCWSSAVATVSSVVF